MKIRRFLQILQGVDTAFSQRSALPYLRQKDYNNLLVNSHNNIPGRIPNSSIVHAVAFPGHALSMIAEKKYMETELQRCIARNNKVAELFEKLHEDNVEGKVTDEWFLQLSHKYEVERMELKEKIAELRGSISDLDSMQTNKDQFIHAIRKFMEMQTLTAPLLWELIDHINVYETECTGKNRTQRIMIHYKFVGVIEIPDDRDNYTADTRKGVAVEYVTKSA